MAVMTGATEFLREYFRGTEGRIYLGAVRNAKSTLGRGEVDKLVTRRPSEINKFIAEHDKPEREVSIYYCTATILDGQTTREAGNCQQFPSLFADCDDHNHELKRPRVIELLEALECPPTMIVNSGHGLQPHWLLSEPSEDAERIIAARKKLQAILASDAVHDAPRYMRLPGSHNSKGGDWLPVEIVAHHPERRYTLEVLEEWLDTAAAVIPRKAKAKTNGNGVGNSKSFVLPPSTGTGTDHKRGAAWARKALEESARELATTQPGSRHGMLLKKANRMATMIARGWIDMLEVRHALFAAAEACGEIKEYGIEHFNKTFADGIKHGMTMPHADLPNDAHHEPASGYQQEAPPLAPAQQPGLPEQPAPPLVPPGMILTFFDQLTEVIPKPWLIKNVIARGEASSWIAQPGKGKSALLIDIAIHLAGGKDWRGYRTKGRYGVVYFGLERADLIKRRLIAHRLRDNLPNLPIAVCGQVIDLMNRGCVKIILDAIQQTEQRFACEVGLAVIDTYPKGIAAGGGDESQAKDQNIVLANLRRVLDQKHIHIAGIGHTGKDESKGERGSNARLADVDLLVHISGDGIKTATVNKANDQPEDMLTSFRLEPFDFGPDEDGDPFRTFILSEDVPAGGVTERSSLSDRQKLAIEALIEATLSHGKDAPAEHGLPAGVKVVTAEQWKTEIYRRKVLDPDGKNPRARFNELRTALAAKKLIGVRDELVWAVH
jgi:hypothetical protein